MSVPDHVRVRLKESLWRRADELEWLRLAPMEKSRSYENWTKAPGVGGLLQRYMPFGQVRVYIKDTLLKDYSRERQADPEVPMRLLGIDGGLDVEEFYVKPHGRRFGDGRVVCWGRASDWKSVIVAAFERAYLAGGGMPFAVVLTQASGRLAESDTRERVEELARRVGIQKVVWA